MFTSLWDALTKAGPTESAAVHYHGIVVAVMNAAAIGEACHQGPLHAVRTNLGVCGSAHPV